MAAKRKAPKRGHNLNGNTKIQNPTALTLQGKGQIIQMLESGAYTRRELAEAVGSHTNSVDYFIAEILKADDFEAFEYNSKCSVTGSRSKRVTLNSACIPTDAELVSPVDFPPVQSVKSCRQLTIFDKLQ